jgi:hypothetical protein
MVPNIAVVIPARQQRTTATNSMRIAMERISLDDRKGGEESSSDEDDFDEVNLVKY